MNVAELFAKLGVKVDEGSFKLAERALARVKAQAEADSLSKAISSVLGDSSKAMAMIGFEGQDVLDAQSHLAEKRAQRWGKVWGGVMKGAAIATGASVAFMGGAHGLMGLVDATAAAGGAADEMSQKLGVSAEVVQELGYAAGLSGSSTEGLNAALGKLSMNVENAKSGSKDAAKAFREVGLNVSDVVSGKLPLDSALEEIADRFKAMPDGAKKSALAMKLFGKSGRELIPLLNEGKDGIAALRKEAHEMGAVIDNDTAKALEGFGDETDKVKIQFAGLRNDAIKAILPELQKLVKGAQAWIKANRADIVAAMTTAMKAFLVVVKGLGLTFAWMIKHSTAAKIILAALAAAFIYLGIQAGIAWITVLGPIALVVAAIVALALAWDDIVAFFKLGGKAIGASLKWIGDKFKAVGRGIRAAFSSIKAFFKGIADGIRAAFTGVLNWLIRQLNKAIDAVNFLIKKANKLPGLDMGTIEHISEVGKKTASISPTRSMSTVAGGSSVNVNGTTTINVTSTQADPAAVASAVDVKMRDFWDRQMRNAGAIG